MKANWTEYLLSMLPIYIMDVSLSLQIINQLSQHDEENLALIKAINSSTFTLTLTLSNKHYFPSPTASGLWPPVSTHHRKRTWQQHQRKPR